MKKFSTSLVTASVLASGLMFSAMANAEGVEVSASAAVANMYLWRGQDLSAGSPAISGDIHASMSGAYAGVWASSGDDVNGQEYDLYLGYGTSFGDFSFDVSLWNYLYPSQENSFNDNVGDLSELVIALGYGPVKFTYYDNIAGGSGSGPDFSSSSGYEYYTLAASVGAYSALIGYSDSEPDSSDYVHVDLGYNYNDNLSFKLSQVVAVEDEDVNPTDKDLKVIVTYTLPIKM